MNQLEQNQWEKKFLNPDELRDFQKIVSSRSKEAKTVEGMVKDRSGEGAERFSLGAPAG